jgi:phage replication O-like protein O
LADVQVEHGHVRIANNLYEALSRANVPGRHLRVALVMIRLLYGYNRTEDRIAASQVAKLTGIPRPHVCVILLDLEKWGLLERQDSQKGRASRWRVGKDFDRWELAGTSEAARRQRQPVPRPVHVREKVHPCTGGSTTPVREAVQATCTGERTYQRQKRKTVPKDKEKPLRALPARAAPGGNDLTRIWEREHQRAHPYVWLGPRKEAIQLAGVLKAVGDRETFEHLVRAFHDIRRDPFVERLGFSVTAFTQRFRQLSNGQSGAEMTDERRKELVDLWRRGEL